MPAFAATSDGNPRVKRSIGPELPRPNPVRIPTPRALAPYGIKLPSQHAVLHQAFSEQQQARYGHNIILLCKPPAVSQVDTYNAFSFSPMDCLVDDDPSERATAQFVTIIGRVY